MKKLNKTLLLASTLFVSSTVSLADKSYADEGYDLNVEPSKSTNLDNNETQTNNEAANLKTNEASEDESSFISDEENESFETNNDSTDETTSFTPQENTFNKLQNEESEQSNQIEETSEVDESLYNTETNKDFEDNVNEADETNKDFEDNVNEADEANKDFEDNVNEADEANKDSKDKANESDKDASEEEDTYKLDNKEENSYDKDNEYNDDKQTISKENLDDVVYYNNKNLDEIFNPNNNEEKSNNEKKNQTLDTNQNNISDNKVEEEKSEDSNDSSKKLDDSESKEEGTSLEETNYYSQKEAGYLVNEDGNIKYYEDNKLVKNARIRIEDKIYDIDQDGIATNPKSMWSSINKNIFYMDEEGNITRGIREINGSKYYFNNQGHLQRNKIVVTNKSIYNISDDGCMINPKNQWINVNNNKYYNDNNGNLLKGIATIDNKSYYFDNKGVLSQNKKLIAADKYYVVDRNGVATNPKNAWFSINGKTYRSDQNGKLVKGARSINNNTYVFESNGVMIQNRPAISAGKYYKIDNRGVATVVKNSWVELDGKKYHTNENGYVKEGVWKIDNKYYYFTQNGLTPNKTVTQKGIVYTVNQDGVATTKDNNVKCQKNLDKALEWMFNAKNSKMTYNMGAGRTSSTQADCSSAVYRSLIYGGFLSKDAWVGNTETLFQMGANGSIMYEVSENELQYGDIFVSGRPGGSVGAAGHTGFILNPHEDTIIHMTYSKNGVAVTPRKGYMGDSRGLPVRYYRLVGANSKGEYLNRK